MPPRKKPAAKKSRQFIRNIRYVPVSIRFAADHRIELAPRGERGDTAPISEEETESQVFLDNEGLVFEVISAEDAKDTVNKQSKNQTRPHPAMNMMRNALGEEYEQTIKVEKPAEDQGINPAQIDERGMITRLKAPGTEDRPVPHVPDDVPPEEAADWVARNSKVEGPEAGLGGLKVSKDPPQKS